MLSPTETATASSGMGAYPITLTWGSGNGNQNDNNDATLIPGTYFITELSLFASVNGYSGVYDGQPHGIVTLSWLLSVSSSEKR